MKQTTIRCAIRGVTFPPDPVSAPSWPAAAAQHGIFAIKNDSRLEHWSECSGDITPRGRFKCSFS